MRLVILAAIWSFVLTIGAVAALAAEHAVLAVLALAALAAIVAWFAAQHTDEAFAGGSITGSAATLSLTVTGRSPAGWLLPLIAAQVVGAVAAGGLARTFPEAWTPTLAWREPEWTTAVALGLFIGLLGGWLVVFIDGYLSEGLAAAPVLLGGGFLGLGYALVFHPATLIGLALAGATTWSTSLAAAVAALAGAVFAGLSVGWLVPSDPDDIQNADA